MKNQFIIGMDGGGTKTHAIITDRSGEILAEHIAGPSNFQIIGVEKAAETIYALIEMCCDSVGCSIKQVSAVACGLTGAGRVVDQERMAKGLKKYSISKKNDIKKIIIESDARIALEGAFKGAPGIIIIAGTGSIAFGKDSKGIVHRVGGWGRILGDEGSGYFLGRHGLSAVTRQMDGRGEKTKLTKILSEKFGLKDQTEIINAVYKDGFDIASVAPFVLKAAEANDSVCRMIVELAAMELITHIRVASEKISLKSKKNIREKIHLSFIGGLIANDTLLSRMMKIYLKENFPHIELISPMASPAFGAVVMAMNSK